MTSVAEAVQKYQLKEISIIFRIDLTTGIYVLTAAVGFPAA